jgi:hypothetical protein
MQCIASLAFFILANRRTHYSYLHVWNRKDFDLWWHGKCGRVSLELTIYIGGPSHDCYSSVVVLEQGSRNRSFVAHPVQAHFLQASVIDIERAPHSGLIRLRSSSHDAE